MLQPMPYFEIYLPSQILFKTQRVVGSSIGSAFDFQSNNPCKAVF